MPQVCHSSCVYERVGGHPGFVVLNNQLCRQLVLNISQSEKHLYHTRVNAINIYFQMNGIASKAEKKMSCVMTVCILGKGPKNGNFFITFAIKRRTPPPPNGTFSSHLFAHFLFFRN